MKDLLYLARACVSDLTEAGIPIGNVRNWKVGTRGKNQWGLCKMVAPCIYDITISAALLEDSVEDQVVKNTIAHELLHTVDGCMNHGKHWHRLAALVNHRCPGYNVKSRTSAEEKGIHIEFKYLLRCTGCGATVGRHRRSRFVERPKLYLCSKCGGKFERIQ